MAIHQMHDVPWNAHISRNLTLNIISASYCWPAMDRDAAAYIASCDSCKRNKAHHSSNKKYRVPLTVPERPFQIIVDIQSVLRRYQIRIMLYDMNN